ncbi:MULTISPECIES: hypothetical protein [unclassified Acinetobacter]|uniref:hypothetical protein n=1 Tax=unclassified Acinetobacter TaxID=196816 RepID=UPI00244829B3|nr:MULTISPECIES: hypothetical protein [unclassified Acinetobacter]MDH0032132.1 hypothetical protein [Acinetobacter sp. GD04021]MDH0887851.1 hypothetical protein [Acinetobacter sp. GD03873]MDH1081909.1 hypothetical protein [Acinetobacter sp. GD03983]MDH2191167.1 hypothetical protein [Acinetobacter sp. GD03645]MDH2204648.1 hypothetical protein [Acinetobacter sp. GD03647]
MFKITIIFFLPLLLGCKEKKVEDFKYEFYDSKLCALKTSDMRVANDFGLLDSSFKYKENIFDEKLSVDIYEKSLKNLSDKQTQYIFCFDPLEVKYNGLETQIRLEIKKGKYLRQYEFINYSCVYKDDFRLNLSKNQFVKCNLNEDNAD